MSEAHDPIRFHTAERAAFETERARVERLADRCSLLRLGTFLGAVMIGAHGCLERDAAGLGAGGVLLVAFFVAVAWHAKLLARVERARIRRDVHERQIARLQGRWVGFESRGSGLLPRNHPYAWDVDLLGEGSLFQRIDVTHTVHGERLLAAWLGAPASRDVIARRQAAVRELAAVPAFCRELEAAALEAGVGHKLDGSPLTDLVRLEPTFASRAWLVPLVFVLPLATLGLYLFGSNDLLPGALWLVPFAGQVALVAWSGKRARRAFDLGTARQSVVESFERMLRLVDTTRFESALLRALQERMRVGSKPPAAQMRRLASWVSASELRRQFLFHLFINPFALWDLHVLRGLERWIAEVGRHTGDWFEALGELEALASLATLAHGDPATSFPEIVGETDPLRATEIVHPLLLPATRVANDLALRGPGTALVVTGSNMAGKSTLLRAVGLNLALALAGGPVCARVMRVPPVRLRASIRAEDSLQRGASYFHAELEKLRTVLAEAEASPPIFFLVDELLRGTNQRARHLGGRAVVLHLLARRATGLVATHDVALGELADEFPEKVANVHFTDVVVEGEMRFDYRLRPGVVQGSNALRLLAMAGVEVPNER